MGAPLPLPPTPPSPPTHPRDAEIQLTENVARRLFLWANWYIRIMSTVGVILFASFAIFGWTSFKDFRDSIKDFNSNVKPQVQGIKEDVMGVKPQVQAAKQDILDVRKDAAAAKKQLRETIDDANNQLKSVKNVTNKITQLEKDVESLNTRMVELQKRVAISNPPQSATPIPPQKCEEVEVHVVAPSPNDFNFQEQRVGTTGESLNLGASCSQPREGEPEAKVLFNLQGPFYFLDGGGQTMMRPVMGASLIHIGISFRPAVVGPASGTLQISSPDGARIRTPKSFDNPAKLTGVGK